MNASAVWSYLLLSLLVSVKSEEKGNRQQLTTEQLDMIRTQRPHPQPQEFKTIRPTDPLPRSISSLLTSRDHGGDHRNGFLTHHVDLSELNTTFELLVLVESSSSDPSWRSFIRETWRNHAPSSGTVLVIFAIPTQDTNVSPDLINESKRYNDMILFSSVHSIQPGSGRLLHYLHWVQDMFSFRYLLRTHDNYFVRVREILETLSQIQSSGNSHHLYLGYFRGNQSVNNRLDPTWYLCPSYTPHADDGAFILSVSLVRRFLKQKQFLNYYENEGASIGLWCSPYRDVTLFHDVTFNSGRQSRGCMRSYTVTLATSPIHMKELHQHYILSGELYCPVEHETEASYLYDWNQIPSQCCSEKVV